MDAALYVNTTTNSIRASTTGTAYPDVAVRLRNHLKLTVYFFASGGDPALISGVSFRVALKDINEPTGSVLALLTAATATGDDYYEFEWDSVDSAALRTLMGDSPSIGAVLEVEWTVGDVVERANMPVVIGNAWIATTDSAPDPTADASWEWLKLRAPEANGFTHDDTDKTLAVSGGSGTGDVVGPASATNGAFALFNGTTGKLLQSGGTPGGAALLNVGTTSGTVAAGDDSRLSDARTPVAHASSHTDGTDDIQSATASQKGLATAAQIAKLDGIEANADVTDATNIASAIDGATAKTTPVDADTVPLIDSAASNVLKKLSWANIKATLKSYFDTLYGNVTGPASATDDAIATYDGTTGKLVQNSALKIIGSVLTWASGSSSGSGSGGNGGSVNITGGNGSETDLNSASGGSAGSISLRGGNATSDEFGAYNGGSGGGIQMIGSDATVSAAGNNAGSINTSGGDNGAGGAITTADGGGSLDTKQGYLELGPSGTRTTIQAGNFGDVTINLPQADGSSGQFLQTDGAGNWSWSSPSGSGDVVGPASSVNSDVALFDGTSGKLLKAQSGLAFMDAIFGSTQGSIIYRNVSQWTWLTPGTSGQVLTTQGAGANPQWAAASGGKVAQMVVATTSTPASTTAIIPLDDTVPQISEGTEFITATITPTNASSTLIIEFDAWVSASSAIQSIYALFKDSNSSALQVQLATVPLNTFIPIRLRWVVTAGSTSSQTYKIRVGPDRAATLYLLRWVSAASYFDTADSAVLTITEVTP